jgi:hypothetical protein
MVKFDFDLSHRMPDLDMQDPVVVSTTSKGEPVVAYVNEYNGRQYAHIRSLYQGHRGEWRPGKGISFLRDEMTDILTRLVERFAEDEPKAQPSQETRAIAQAALDRAKNNGLPITSPTAKTNGGVAEAFRKRAKQITNGEVDPDAPVDPVWREFMILVGQLSPENLSCDGELNRGQIAMRKSAIMKKWRVLEKKVGRLVTEDEVWRNAR